MSVWLVGLLVGRSVISLLKGRGSYTSVLLSERWKDEENNWLFLRYVLFCKVNLKTLNEMFLLCVEAEVNKGCIYYATLASDKKRNKSRF